MTEFFLRQNQTIRGPLAATAVRELAEQGKLRPDDELSRGIDGPWKPASSFRRLQSIFSDRTTDDSGIITLFEVIEQSGERLVSGSDPGITLDLDAVWLVLEKGKKKQGPFRLDGVRDYVDLPGVQIRHIRGAWVDPGDLPMEYPELVSDKLVGRPPPQTRKPTSVTEYIGSFVGGTVGLAFVAGVVFVIYKVASNVGAFLGKPGGDTTDMLGFDLTLHDFFYGMAVLGGAMIGSVFTWFGFLVMLVEKDSDNQTGTGCLAFLLFGGVFLFIIGLCGGAIF